MKNLLSTFLKQFDCEKVPELQRMCMDWAPCKRLREKEIFDRCEVPTRDPPEQKNKTGLSSLHWITSLSIYSFLYNGLYLKVSQLSISDVLLCEKCHFLKRQMKEENTVL